jgi:hypothetical protein
MALTKAHTSIFTVCLGVAGMALALGPTACGSQDTGSGGSGGRGQGGGNGGTNPGVGGTNPGVGGTNPGVGGTNPGVGGTNPGVGGTNPGTGGTNPGTGGTNPGTGGTNPGTGGTGTLGTGGTDPGTGGTGTLGTGGTGTLGTGGTGTLGTGGGSSHPDCDGRGETPTNVITQPCGSFITPFPVPGGTKIQLGPYGARMDVNVGAGFENPDPADTASCAGFAAIFGEDPMLTNQLLNVGPQPCSASGMAGNCLNMRLYSVYYPATWPEGPIPVLAWGNGTCAQPEGYGALLRYIASYGFVVFAPNSRQAGTGATLRKALDFAAAANANGPYAGHLDMSKVGVMGHSQGSGAANGAASDSRVKAVILYNGGTSNAKPFLAVSGVMDIGGLTQASMASAVNAATKGAYLWYLNPVGQGSLKGHLTLMLSPQRLTDQSVSFWQMTLNNDAAARAKFVGANCAFCGKTDYTFGQKGF